VGLCAILLALCAFSPLEGRCSSCCSMEAVPVFWSQAGRAFLSAVLCLVCECNCLPVGPGVFYA
jgi:hypothetical protein